LGRRHERHRHDKAAGIFNLYNVEYNDLQLFRLVPVIWQADTEREKLMSKHRTNAHDTGATSLSRDRELDDNELDSVTGGLVVIAIIAVLTENISLVGPATTNGQRGTGGKVGP
jgi:hypothetical protein